MTTLDQIQQPRGTISSEVTAIEQARAVAEVAAAVRVAQEVPRDVQRAEREMEDACGRIALANRAFYTVRNRGNGPSVHLARELARIFGNVQFGVHELRRDDAAGISEIQAFAWDVQQNVRSTRTFIVPHVRMAGGRRQPLTDVQDIYLSNQNIGARAVRECIFTVLPAWFTDKAQDLAHETLERGTDAGAASGPTLPERITAMVDAFAKGNVTDTQLIARVGKPLADWSPEDLAQMGVVYQSLQRRETTVDDEFGSTDDAPSVDKVTRDELAGGAQ